MESLEVFTQEELDDALARPGVIPVCVGEGAFEVGAGQFVRAADYARLTLRDAAADAGGAAHVLALGACDVTAVDTVNVDAHDTSVVDARGQSFVRAHDRVRVTARAFATVEASEAAVVTAENQASVRALDDCVVHLFAAARATVSGSARAFATDIATVRAFGDARVAARRSASVHASGQAHVDARESVFVVAGGHADVRAFGDAMVRARGAVTVRADDTVAIKRQSRHVSISGGQVTERLPFGDAQEWCRHYGVHVEDGVATLYKAVDNDFNSYHGTSYRPGSEPVAPDWDGGEQECGRGLHFWPAPVFALTVETDEQNVRFVACPVRLEDIAVFPAGRYPDQVKARAVCAPVYEVHADGTPVEGAA